jgi:hypothetical protein
VGEIERRKRLKDVRLRLLLLFSLLVFGITYLQESRTFCLCSLNFFPLSFSYTFNTVFSASEFGSKSSHCRGAITVTIIRGSNIDFLFTPKFIVLAAVVDLAADGHRHFSSFFFFFFFFFFRNNTVIIVSNTVSGCVTRPSVAAVA